MLSQHLFQTLKFSTLGTCRMKKQISIILLAKMCPPGDALNKLLMSTPGNCLETKWPNAERTVHLIKFQHKREILTFIPFIKRYFIELRSRGNTNFKTQ
jgi:hypothetical protein